MVALHRTLSLLLAASLSATSTVACCFGPPMPSPADRPDAAVDEGDAALRRRWEEQRPSHARMTPLPDVMERAGVAQALSAAEDVTPMRPNAGALFDQARPHTGPIARGLLICRARIQGHFDLSFFAGGADVALSFRVGEQAWMTTPQAPSRVFTLPLADVTVGTSLQFNLVDQDLIFHDEIAALETTYTASPFALQGEQATLQCRVMPDVSEQAGQALERYQRSLESLSPEPDLRDTQLGFVGTERVVASATQAASWLGWRAPEMLATRTRAVEIDLAFERSVGLAVIAARETLPVFGERLELRDRSLRVVRFACGDGAEAMRVAMGSEPFAGTSYCRAIVEVRAKTHLTLGAIRGIDAPEMWALQTSGARDRVQRIAVHQEDAWVRPDRPVVLDRNETCEVHIGLSRPASLLRVGAELAGTPTLVRLE